MSESDPVGQAELNVAETIGQLMQFWGFKRPMGRMWTLLYLSPDPLGAAELGERLRMSAGAVSMTINELLKWGAIRRTWRPGERRDYFECEVSIWKLVRRVLHERELTLVREAKERLAGALGTIEAGAVTTEASEVLAFKRSRMETLRNLAGVGEMLLGAIDAGEAIDPSVLQAVVAAGAVEPNREDP
ncbi:MAG: hypothetical protein JW751_29670 [Polyangiaceae bacterium]|nr:hypothetical protein [Polyangiaceae bacterium]